MAGIRVRFSSPEKLPPIRIAKAQKSFVHFDSRDVDIEVEVRAGPGPERDGGRELFQASELWRVDDFPGGRLLTVFAPHEGGRIHAEAWLNDDDPSSIQLWVCPPRDGWGDTLPALDYPLDELLFGQILARGSGVIVHSASVRSRGRGMLFAGVSGAGKSTLAEILSREDDVVVQSDDRNVIRFVDGKPWVFGTPWHGDVEKVAAGGARLDRIFFLEHGQENTTHAVPPAEACATLLARTFPPYWDAEQLAAATDLVARVTEHVPPERLAFLPDESVLRLLGIVTEDRPVGPVDLAAVARAVLERGGTFRFRARGQSMTPAVRDGETLEIAPLGDDPVRFGEVILYEDPGRGLVVHRVREVDAGMVRAGGDRSPSKEESVPISVVIGRVIGVASAPNASQDSKGSTTNR